MTGEPDGDDILLSDSERLHALNVLGGHYASGRLDVGEFYDRSGAIASARTLSAIREPFRGLPGGIPFTQVDGHLRPAKAADAAPVPNADHSPFAPIRTAESELSSLRRRGHIVESLDWLIVGGTLMAFLVLQFAVGWDYAWIVWPSLIVTLGVPRMILRYSDEDEEIYEELKESDATARKKRLQQAAERIQELGNDRGNRQT